MVGPLEGTVGRPAVATTDVEDVDAGTPGSAVGRPVAAATEVEDIDGGPPGGAVGRPTATTTEVEDVDGGPPEGCWPKGRQQPPPKMKTSMADPVGVLSVDR
jgi:hypothetical protein